MILMTLPLFRHVSQLYKDPLYIYENTQVIRNIFSSFSLLSISSMFLSCFFFLYFLTQSF